MPKLDYRNIEKDAARCGGQPVVVATRIRVATILTCYRLGMTVEEIVANAETDPLPDYNLTLKDGHNGPVLHMKRRERDEELAMLDAAAG